MALETASSAAPEAPFSSARPALVIVDVQQAIDEFSAEPRNNPDAEAVVAVLLRHWRASGLPVWHVRHASRCPASPYHRENRGFAFKPESRPLAGEPVVTKQENCAFLGTDLQQRLQSRDISELVICGVLTNNSVDATVRVAAGLGFSVLVPHDACAAFAMALRTGAYLDADTVHWAFLDNLDDEYCRVRCSADIIAALPGSDGAMPEALND